MPPTGKGKKKILVIAEAPGEEEDRQNTQLIGRTGQYFRRCLRTLDIDLDIDCWKTNAVICRRKGNKTPTDEMIEACRPNLMKTVEKYNPNVIILLGGVAVQSLLGIVYNADVGSISRWGDYCIPCRNPNAWIIPTYHPSHILRKNSRVLRRIFKRHLKMAISKIKSKPWKVVPSYKDQIEIIVSPSRAAKIIRHISKQKGYISFDYETNTLKPEREDSKIVSCSVCWNDKKTISYPWVGDAVDATAELLKTDIPKIASNIKFEDRWTRAKLGFNVRRWYWDTMLAAHVINNNPGVTSIKFQAFVLLGQESYNNHIEPFLEDTKNGINRIDEIDIRDLLEYGGLDSLMEFKVAMKQVEILK